MAPKINKERTALKLARKQIRENISRLYEIASRLEAKPNGSDTRAMIAGEARHLARCNELIDKATAVL